MNEEEYYIANRDKIDLKNISTWKYLPVGDSMRKVYDYNYLPLNQFLAIYYKSYSNNEQWQVQWMNSIILPAFENDLEKLANRIGIGVYSNFSHEKMTEFYSKIKNTQLFSNDIKLFISWMCGMNFFEKQNITFQNWIGSKNFNIGGRHQPEEDLYSLEDISKEQFGDNLIRDKLMSLEWHKR